MNLQTPLHAAALDDKHQFVALLLQAGANLDSVDASGEKPLQLAMKNRAEECVRTITMEMGSFQWLIFQIYIFSFHFIFAALTQDLFLILYIEFFYRMESRFP